MDVCLQGLFLILIGELHLKIASVSQQTVWQQNETNPSVLEEA